MVSTGPLISKSISPCINFLASVPKTPITIGIFFTFMFLCFLNTLAGSGYLSYYALFSIFVCDQQGWQSPQFGNSFFVNYYHYYLLLQNFSHQLMLMDFHWSLSDSKSPQVSRTLLSILFVLNNTVVWMLSTRPLTSKFSSPFNNPKAPISIGIIVTFMFHSFFLTFFALSFSFILWSAGTGKSTI